MVELMTARSLMFLGTHSNAGKSLLTTAFCRILARRGLRVAPFKAQNMSNNAGITPEGGEMGRAQLVQAEAAGIAPHTDMNPVLLKPEADRRSQIVLNGRVYGHIDAANWADIKRLLWDEVRAAYDRLATRYDIILMEGAGSPAEINLKHADIVNLRMARHADAPCLLIGDIDRGGVFAALAGTMLLLEPEERTQIKGFLINKFRGDPVLLGNATEMLQGKAYGVPTLGVIPFIPDLLIASEDAVTVTQSQPADEAAQVEIAIIQFPHIANFDEFDALIAEPGVQVRYVREAEKLGHPHIVILPGTKVTVADLAWMRQRKLDEVIVAAYHNGATVIGICGGFQMLGQHLADPLGVENIGGRSDQGLGLLPVSTEFCPRKQTSQSQMRLSDGTLLTGYEIHAGESHQTDRCQPFGRIVERNGQAVDSPDGAVSVDGRVWGCYLHGIFENNTFRHRWLASFGWTQNGHAIREVREQAYDHLADVVEAAINLPAIEELLGL